MTAAAQAGAGKLRFSVRLTPKGGRNAIEGWQAAPNGRRALKVRVAAPPENGKANEALVALLAETLGIAKSCIRIVGGVASRVKTLEIDGDSAMLSMRLERAGGAS